MSIIDPTEENARKLQETMAALIATHGEAALQRLISCVEFQLGMKEPTYGHPLQRPRGGFFPGLPAKPWYDPGEYDVLRRITGKLEEAFPAIREEALSRLMSQARFQPYIQSEYMEKKFYPVKDMQWASFFIRKRSGPVAENCALCPTAARVQEEISAEIPPFAENFFSVLQAGAVIPPHHDDFNFRLTIQLPLVIPPDCAIEVGDETRVWQEGRCIVFDDSFRHRAWNHSGRDRLVLIVEIWHPEVTAAERAAIGALHQALRIGQG